ncbi:peptidoglycan DD-metalloendopeptidase family protein [Ottowia sp.]|uniref:peptidoglycan DD-metalloendopeptidase family protein n=1 Tax=Ottowia sp. TaxID=1898956 RepID=UPI003A8B40AD
MKQQLIFTGLALADLIHRHPKRIAASIGAVLLCGGGGAYAVASLAPAMPTEPVRLVSDPVDPADTVAAQLDQLDTFSFTLYRSEATRSSDTPEALLKRLGIADPAAAAFLRKNTAVRQALFSKAGVGRMVTAEATDRQELQLLRTHWLDKGDDDSFKRLVVERSDDSFSVRIEAAPLIATQRLAGSVINSTLFAATDEAQVPDSVTRQLIDIFESNVDFHRRLRKGDRFSIVYESLEADGEPVRAGRILSAEIINRGKTHQALWFQHGSSDKGAYYSFDGQSMRKSYLVAPLKVSRITSGFGMRSHPVFGYSREHKGVDYAAPTGTPVRTIGDGVVEFAGVQSGYGKVIYVKHPNKTDTSVYAHLSRINVKAGEKVTQGQTIGAVGASGVATGPHLHLEFRVNNEPQDPTEILAEQREQAPVAAAAKTKFAQLTAHMKSELAAASQLSRSNFD